MSLLRLLREGLPLLLAVASESVSEGCGDDVRRLDVGGRLGLGQLGFDVRCDGVVLGGRGHRHRPWHLIGSSGASGGLPRYEPPRPEDVLAGRFARGEVDEDEYRQRITLLREHR